MPGIAWAVVVVWGALTGSALLGPPPIWSGPDPTVNKGHYKPAPVTYRSWLSSPTIGSDGSCTFTAFGMVSREHATRLRVDGVEQLLDWSWSWTVRVPKGGRGGSEIEFIDAVTGEIVATHTLSEKCWT